jgi:NAD-dependent DNA ligase
MGGRAVTSVSKFTDYLVVGGEFHGLLNGHDKSSKLEAAIALRESGHQIEMLDEVDFLAVLLGGA